MSKKKRKKVLSQAIINIENNNNKDKLFTSHDINIYKVYIIYYA